jgi:hypothetical protein
MAIVSYDGIISARSSGQYEDPFYIKTESITPQAAGVWHSFLNCAGSPASLAITSAAGGVAMNSTIQGAIQLSTPATALSHYLHSAGVCVSTHMGFGAMMLVDVIWGMKGIPLTGTTFDIASTAWTRSTNGVNVQIGIVTDVTGSTASTIIVNYTGDDGTTGKSTVLLTTASKIHCMSPVGNPWATLQATHKGCKSIQSINVGTTIANKTITIIAFKPLMVIPTVKDNVWVERDATLQIAGMTPLEKGTDEKGPYLAWLGLSAGTGACATFMAQIRKVSG